MKTLIIKKIFLNSSSSSATGQRVCIVIDICAIHPLQQPLHATKRRLPQPQFTLEWNGGETIINSDLFCTHSHSHFPPSLSIFIFLWSILCDSAVSKLKIYADQHLRPCVRRCFPLSVDKVTTFLIKDQLVNTSTPHPVSIPKSQLTPKAECVCQQLARHPRSFGLFAYLPLPEAQIKSSACPPEVDLPERGLQRTGHPLGVDVADKQTSCTVAGWSVMLLRWDMNCEECVVHRRSLCLVPCWRWSRRSTGMDEQPTCTWTNLLPNETASAAISKLLFGHILWPIPPVHRQCVCMCVTSPKVIVK